MGAQGDLLDAVEELTHAVRALDGYDWEVLLVTAASALGTLAAVVVALLTSRQARSTAATSLTIAEKAAEAAADSAATAQSLLQLEQLRLGNEYRESMRGAVERLNATLVELRGVIATDIHAPSGISIYQFLATKQQSARIAADALAIAAKDDDVLIALAIIGALNAAKQHSFDERVLEPLDVCIDSLQSWFQHGGPEAWSEPVHEVAQQLQELRRKDGGGLGIA